MQLCSRWWQDPAHQPTSRPAPGHPSVQPHLPVVAITYGTLLGPSVSHHEIQPHSSEAQLKFQDSHGLLPGISRTQLCTGGQAVALNPQGSTAGLPYNPAPANSSWQPQHRDPRQPIRPGTPTTPPNSPALHKKKPYKSHRDTPEHIAWVMRGRALLEGMASPTEHHFSKASKCSSLSDT